MRLSGQFQTSFFFFYETILSVKKHRNAKQTTFTFVEVFVRTKTYCLCCFLFACFSFVSWFWFDLHLVCVQDFFVRKKTDLNCLDNPIILYYLRLSNNVKNRTPSDIFKSSASMYESSGSQIFRTPQE